MFPNINRAFQLLQAWIKYPRRQATLIRKIVDRIRNSLELQVVLQTSVDEVTTLLKLDACSFLWYFPETQRIQVVCEQNGNPRQASHLGYHPIESFGTIADQIAAGELIVNSGKLTLPRTLILDWIAQRLPWLLDQRLRDRDVAAKSPYPSQSGCHVLGYGASLLIPVIGKADSIGFIACLSQQPRAWSAAEIELLQSIAEPLEIAIRQAKLYEQTQKQAVREHLVNHIISQTRQSFDLEIILTEAIAQILTAFDADRCFIHLVEDPSNPEIGELNLERGAVTKSGKTFRRKYLYEVCREPFPPSINDFDPHGPITQWVIQHRQLVMIPDITQDERIGKTNPEYQKAQIKSSLVVPVQANGTVYALLYLNQCSHLQYWTKDDQKVAQSVADQLAISLRQAYLYAHIQQQAADNAMQAQKLSDMIEELRRTQAQLIQSEKMSSLGRMVAGVAHEINNPVNFIYGNIPYVENYVSDLIRLVQSYQVHYPDPASQVQKLIEEADIDFLLRDLPKILQSMKTGAERIHEIVQLLQKFSRQNEAPLKLIDINAALESTLLILHNQITGRIKVERYYDQLPPVECYPKPINQAFLSILTNAIEALNRWPEPNKVITLKTKWLPSSDIGNEGQVRIVIADNGPGIKLEIQSKIFEPFFTTKDVGQGRGLGLTGSYQTIVGQHKGQLHLRSKPNLGAEFLIEIPIRLSQSLTSESSTYMERTSRSPVRLSQPQATISSCRNP